MSDMAETPGTAGRPMQVRPVRKAYEQVADQLHELILSGELSAGQRLPTELEVAKQFGVSRATVREALRVLSAQKLLRTVKGTHGGSFVTVPTVDHISQFLQANLSLMSRSDGVTLSEFLEARECIEVPGARLAAQRRSEGDLAALQAAIPDEPLAFSVDDQFSYNKRWHSAVMEASQNSLLRIAAQPVFVVLQFNLQRSALGRQAHQSINRDHHLITAAIVDGDANRAEKAMRDHLAVLRPIYEEIWRNARERTHQS